MSIWGIHYLLIICSLVFDLKVPQKKYSVPFMNFEVLIVQSSWRCTFNLWILGTCEYWGHAGSQLWGNKLMSPLLDCLCMWSRWFVRKHHIRSILWVKIHSFILWITFSSQRNFWCFILRRFSIFNEHLSCQAVLFKWFYKSHHPLSILAEFFFKCPKKSLFIRSSFEI